MIDEAKIAQLRTLVETADAEGVEAPEVEVARKLIQNHDLEDAVAGMMHGLGAKGLEMVDPETGSVEVRLDWDDDGKVIR